MSSSFTAHQHILGYFVPYHGMVDLHKKGDIIKAICFELPSSVIKKRTIKFEASLKSA